MKLDRLTVSGFLGVNHAEADLSAAVNLFAGRNFSGKSSLRDAIALALTGALPRVDLKKDAGLLVYTGADSALVEIAYSVASEPQLRRVTISRAGKIAEKGTPDGSDLSVLPYVLDAQRFASLDTTARRAFLFGLMGVQTDPASIRAVLERQAPAELVAAILPELRKGFTAAAAEAKTRATEARGSWKAITGETFGSEKAKTWHAEAPAFDPAAMAALSETLDEFDRQADKLLRDLGRLEAEKTRRTDLQSRIPALQAAASRVQAVEEKLARDLADLEEWEAKHAAATIAASGAPRVGLLHDLARAAALLLEHLTPTVETTGTIRTGWPELNAAVERYTLEHGAPGAAIAGAADQAAKLPEITRARDLMRSAVSNDRRDLEAAKSAAAALATITAELEETFDAAELSSARESAEGFKARRAELVGQIDALAAAKRAAESAEKRTADAAAHASQAAGWDTIAGLLSPDGIPARLIASALTPINERLAQSAADTGWTPAILTGDMAITAGGRDYRLLSESERWRVDAMLAEAISHLSGARLLVLDRFDVLEIAARPDLIAWLEVLADAGEIDSALLFGTLKAPPTGLPDHVRAHWIDAGTVADAPTSA